VLKSGGENIDDDIPPKKRKLEQPPNILPADFFSDPTRTFSSDVENAVMGSSDLESEYRRFQREILAAPDYSETYERVTVVAEPQLFSEEYLSNISSISRESALAPIEKPADEDRKREERELILDRLLEEERAQEEADIRVGLMKKRLEAVKRRRQALHSEMPLK
jgi:zinc finger protein 830